MFDVFFTWCITLVIIAIIGVGTLGLIGFVFWLIDMITGYILLCLKAQIDFAQFLHKKYSRKGSN
ncbi:hypothetical protein [Microcystis phage MaeS]|nr:hypothetical protein [Microcystis phage MaeS]